MAHGLNAARRDREFGSRRPPVGWNTADRVTRRLGHKIERQQGKVACETGLAQMREDDAAAQAELDEMIARLEGRI